MNAFDPAAIRALVFDVFGTVVDWRATIVREGQALAAAKGLSVDWPAFADAWRAGYQPAMARAVAPGPDGASPPGRPKGEHRSAQHEGTRVSAWANIDVLHREILDTLLPRFGLTGLSEPERAHLNLVWHRLDPWPDSVRGLRRLKSRFVIATLSNGNIALLVNMAKHARLPWDCVLSGELARRYKPDPEVYRMAARLLGVECDEVLMVAAHPSDLRGAHAAGLRTAYVPRPFERGPNPDGAPPPDALPDDRFDVVAADFVELAARLGA